MFRRSGPVEQGGSTPRGKKSEIPARAHRSQESANLNEEEKRIKNLIEDLLREADELIEKAPTGEFYTFPGELTKYDGIIRQLEKQIRIRTNGEWDYDRIEDTIEATIYTRDKLVATRKNILKKNKDATEHDPTLGRLNEDILAGFKLIESNGKPKYYPEEIMEKFDPLIKNLERTLERLSPGLLNVHNIRDGVEQLIIDLHHKKDTQSAINLEIVEFYDRASERLEKLDQNTEKLLDEISTKDDFDEDGDARGHYITRINELYVAYNRLFDKYEKYENLDETPYRLNFYTKEALDAFCKENDIIFEGDRSLSEEVDDRFLISRAKRAISRARALVNDLNATEDSINISIDELIRCQKDSDGYADRRFHRDEARIDMQSDATQIQRAEKSLSAQREKDLEQLNDIILPAIADTLVALKSKLVEVTQSVPATAVSGAANRVSRHTAEDPTVIPSLSVDSAKRDPIEDEPARDIEQALNFLSEAQEYADGLVTTAVNNPEAIDIQELQSFEDNFTATYNNLAILKENDPEVFKNQGIDYKLEHIRPYLIDTQLMLVRCKGERLLVKIDSKEITDIELIREELSISVRTFEDSKQRYEIHSENETVTTENEILTEAVQQTINKIQTKLKEIEQNFSEDRQPTAVAALFEYFNKPKTNSDVLRDRIRAFETEYSNASDEERKSFIQQIRELLETKPKNSKADKWRSLHELVMKLSQQDTQSDSEPSSEVITNLESRIRSCSKVRELHKIETEVGVLQLTPEQKNILIDALRAAPGKSKIFNEKRANIITKLSPTELNP